MSLKRRTLAGHEGHPQGEAARLLGAAVPTGRNALTGQHGQASRTFRGTRREAEKELAAFYVEVVERPATPPGKRSMGELLDAWFELASADLAPKTAHEYKRIIRARIRPALGHRPVRQVEASEIDRFYRALQRQAGLSAASVRHGRGRRGGRRR